MRTSFKVEEKACEQLVEKKKKRAFICSGNDKLKLLI